MNETKEIKLTEDEKAAITQKHELDGAEYWVNKRRENNLERSIIKTLIDIPYKEIKWLWNFLLAHGKHSIIAGDPGNGKSLLEYYIAANLSRGLQYNNIKTEPCDVIILSGEDDFNDTIRPRLEALDANLSRIHTIESRIANDNRKCISIKDKEALTDAIQQIKLKGGKVQLIILDPLDSFLGGVNAFRNNDVREAFVDYLKLIANEHIASLGICHLNKSSTSSPAYRVGGSIALTALSRCVYITAKDPNSSERRVLLPLKCNLSKDTIGFEYSIQQTENKIPYINIENEIQEDIGYYLQPNIPTKKATSPEQEEILLLLKSIYPETMTSGEIAEKIASSGSSTCMMLKKLEKKGMVEKLKYGKWRSIPDLADSSLSVDMKNNTTNTTTKTNESDESNENPTNQINKE